MVYPMDMVYNRVEEMARKAEGAKSYGLTAVHLQEPANKGAIGFILPSLKRYIQWRQDSNSLPVQQVKVFNTSGWLYLDNKVAREMLNPATNPVQQAGGKK